MFREHVFIFVCSKIGISYKVKNRMYLIHPTLKIEQCPISDNSHYKIDSKRSDPQPICEFQYPFPDYFKLKFVRFSSV